MPGLRPLFDADTIALSIAAGTTLAKLEDGLGAVAIVRSIPNTPAQVGRGITAAVANRRVGRDGRGLITTLLEAVGEVVWVDDEGLIDVVTAVSGSGPAYVFLLAEALSAAGDRRGPAGSDRAPARADDHRRGWRTSLPVGARAGDAAPERHLAERDDRGGLVDPHGRGWDRAAHPARRRGGAQAFRGTVGLIAAWPSPGGWLAARLGGGGRRCVMAKSPGRKRAARRDEPPAPAGTPRERIIDAFMALLAEGEISAFGLGDVAARAEVSLAELREAFDGKLGIIAAFTKRIDGLVLEQGPADPADGARDRLFEVMMRRFDGLAPYKAALKSLARSARRDPGLACMLHRMLERSAKWMLVAAGIRHGGLVGKVAIEGAVLVHLEAMRAWLDDDDPGLARTMAALDRSLRRGERAMQLIGDVCSFLPRMAERGRAGRSGSGSSA